MDDTSSPPRCSHGQDPLAGSRDHRSRGYSQDLRHPAEVWRYGNRDRARPLHLPHDDGHPSGAGLLPDAADQRRQRRIDPVLRQPARWFRIVWNGDGLRHRRGPHSGRTQVTQPRIETGDLNPRLVRGLLF